MNRTHDGGLKRDGGGDFRHLSGDSAATSPFPSAAALVELLRGRSVPLVLCLVVGVFGPGLLRWTSACGLFVFGLAQLADRLGTHSVWL